MSGGPDLTAISTRLSQVSLKIEFDYRFDSGGFFDDPERRIALETGAHHWSTIIQDTFADVPIGTTFTVRNPTTLAVETVNLERPIDDIVIFVGARDLPSSTLAVGGPDGSNAKGDVYAARISSDFRGNGSVTDFEPWAGSITFASGVDWSFSLNDPTPSLHDFLSVAIHEIGHVLGLGTSSAFERWLIDGGFTGPNSMAINNGAPIPIDDDHAHVEDGFAGDIVALDPVLIGGTRVVISEYDKAMLADIGYEIAGFEKQGAGHPITTAASERVFGTNLGDIISGLGGDDSLQGADGPDVLNGNSGDDDLFGQNGNDTLSGESGDDNLDGGPGDDELRGGPGTDVYFGHAGADTFVIARGDGTNRTADFDLSADTLRLIDSDFQTIEDILQAVTKPFSNVSRVRLDDGTIIDLYHDSQFGTPLTVDHFELGEPVSHINARDESSNSEEGEQEGTPASAVLEGTALNDDGLIASSDYTHINGRDGIDTVHFSGDQSSYSVALWSDGVRVTDRRPNGLGTIHLENVELIEFDSGDLVFGEAMDLRIFGAHKQLNQDALEAFVELYIAYFNRAPDALGLGFWSSAFAHGTTREDIAALFVEQDETVERYPSSLSTLHFISDVYVNVLGRAPDVDGLLFWNDALDRGAVSRANFILELLDGVKADLPAKSDADLVARQEEDQQYLEHKTDLGVRFAIELGMSNVQAATDVMLAFDGSLSSFETASRLVDEMHVSASDPESGAFLMPLVGLLDTTDGF